VKEIKLGKGQC